MTILYKYFYKRLTVQPLETDTHIHLLTPTELKAVRRLEWKARIISGVIGTLAVLLLYLPQYQFPQLFPSHDTLQFIAVSKRDFHANHAYLTAKLLPIFDIPIETLHPVPPDYAQRLMKAEPTLQRFCQFIIILGLLLDGQISHKEKQRIETFHNKGILEPTVSELEALKNDFLEGRSIEHLMDKF